MRRAQPNFFLPFNRRGIDPFTERFQVTLRLEGTVRGTGGLRLLGLDCSTNVPGLYAAGDNATREPICGGFTGGGSHNAAWAISTGCFAGNAAADFAAVRATQPPSPVRRLGKAGFSKAGTVVDNEAAIKAVQAEVFPLDINYFRTESALTASLERLDTLWQRLESSGGVSDVALLALRQTAAMTATARWMYNAALARTETRGMHRRDDFPKQDQAQHHRLIVSGLANIAVRSEPVQAASFREAAE